MKLRLIVKCPRTSQTANDAWTDTTFFKTFEIEAPPDLAKLLDINREAVVVGAELLFRRDATLER